MAHEHDVIVVGTRAAGAATALLLARAGVRVLAVDRARFPSDTLSTHQVQLPGVAHLHRWSLLEPLIQAGTPATATMRFDVGTAVLNGSFPQHRGVAALFSPRRTVLDALLVDAARSAGADVRENVDVDDLVWHGDRVVGIRSRPRHGRPTVEQARLVVGADGKNSRVARAVGAARYLTRPASSFYCYTYWAGLALQSGELYHRPGRFAAGAFATNDAAAIVFVAAPLARLAAFRADVRGQYLAALDECGTLGERARSAEQVERFRTAPDLPNTFRVPRGPGWALVGDAGLVMDPITAQGISNAFRDAELLTEAVIAGFGGTTPLDRALAGYHRRRDALSRAMYDFTVQLAAFEPMRPAVRHTFDAISERPDQIERFLGAFAGAAPINEFFSVRNVVPMLGATRIARIAADIVLDRHQQGRTITARRQQSTTAGTTRRRQGRDGRRADGQVEPREDSLRRSQP